MKPATGPVEIIKRGRGRPRSRMRREQAIAQGLCATCRERPAATGLLTCSQCRQEQRDSQNEWYRKKNPEVQRKKRTPGENKRKHELRRWPQELVIKVAGLDGGLCKYCGTPAEQLDHVLPIVAGGETVVENVVTSCGPCNRRKKQQVGFSLDTERRLFLLGADVTHKVVWARLGL